MKRAQLRSLFLKVAIAATLLVSLLAATGVGPFNGLLTSSSDEAAESSTSSGGGGGGDGGSGEAAESEETQQAPAVSAPPAKALLTVEDLPAGWSLEVRGPQGSQDSICGTAFDVTSGGAAAPRIFFSRVPDGDYLAQTLVAFPEGGAAATLDRLRGLLDGCHEWTTLHSNGSEQTWSLDETTLPAVGDELVAFQLSATVGELPLETTQVVIRRGDVLNTVAYISGAETRQRIQPIADIADRKVQGTA
ncbi:MAG: hypothetical protein ACRDH9_08615 [Actinomycetota bacterium]